MPETYTVKEIAAAIAWQDDVCSELTRRLFDGEIDSACSECPIGFPCYCSTENGMENIMRKWKEVRSHDKS